MKELRPSHLPTTAAPGAAATAAIVCLAIGFVAAPIGSLATAAAEPAAEQHLLVSEVMTGGANAADEFIELYNPGPASLPLEGLELAYVSATGTVPSRRAAWPAGAPSVPPGAHVLIANEGGIFASIADAVYASGLAAAGGSVALRIQGASTAIDAVGWGTAANAWMEGLAAPAPVAGASIERLPGGAAGSTQDTGDNLTDFGERAVPDPQNSTSPPTPDPGPTPTATPTPDATPENSPTPEVTPDATPTPGATPTLEPTPSPSASPTPMPTATPTATPGPTPIAIADARVLPDGATATIAGVALTASDFTDGGGYVADASGGIAVLVADGTFARGDLLVVTGVLDDRYAQRTLRADAAGVIVTGAGEDPEPRQVATGEVGEPVEGQLLRLAGTIDGSPTALSGALAFDINDGSGAARVVVATTSGIDLVGWVPGAHLDVVGVAGQRDSTGTGTSGYRVQPRAPADIWSITPPTPTPSPSGSGSPRPSGSPGATATPVATPTSAPTVSVAEARAAAKNTRLRVCGVVTLGTGVVDPRSAVIQDASDAILLRLSDEAGTLGQGQQVVVSGARSTNSGMESLRVVEAPVQLGSGIEPAPAVRSTAAIGEADEARLVVVRGGVVATPRRASSGTLSFEIDDGSGPLRIVIFAAVGADREVLSVGTWIEVTGVVGQETSGAQPTRGYRIWPRDAGDVRLLAAAVDAGDQVREDDEGDGVAAASRTAVTGGLERLVTTGTGGAAMEVEATLVAGPWPQLGLAGVMWDGVRAAGIGDEPTARAAVGRVAAAGLPAAVRLRARPPVSQHGEIGLPIVSLESGSLERSTAGPTAPAAGPPGEGPPIWVRVSGLLEQDAAGAALSASHAIHRLEVRCQPSPLPNGREAVVVDGIGVADPVRVIVGCDGVQLAASLVDGALAPSEAHSRPREATTAGLAAEPAPDGIGAGLLLASGVIGMAGCAIGLRRRGLRWTNPVENAEAAGIADPASAHAQDAGPPSLTLVQLPRERGSP